jgi:lysine 6-dehydrogenase
MGFRYAIIGSGRQGTSAAYDLARCGDAESIAMADQSLVAAERAAARVNSLVGRSVARPAQLDVTNDDAVVRFLREARAEVFVSGVPYIHNLALARCAIRAGASMCDFGGKTEMAREQLALDAEARAAGITLIPDCGQVPGLGTSLCAYAVSLFDEPHDIIMYDGGIPLEPQPPWNYILTFNMGGLTNEYFGTTVFIRDGKPLEVRCFEEYERVRFPENIGELEAFTTAGGTSTMPWTYAGKLRRLENKTVRWPGHYAQWKAFNDAGLLREDPIEVRGGKVAPRDVLHSLLEPQIRARPGARDLVIIRILARGRREGREAEATVDLFDRFDDATGFTAMERTTGWHAAIMAGFIARGETRRGGVAVESAVPPARVVEELARRGLKVQVHWQS